MKKILFAVLALLLVDCGSDEKNNKVETKQEAVKKDKINEKKYPEAENIFDKLDYIFPGSFTFADGLVIEEIGLYRIKDDTYKTVFVLGEDSDFEKVSDHLIGMIYYPSDPLQLETEEEKAQGFIKTAVKTDIQRMEDSFVIIHDEFRIVPKTHKSIKFYFYKGNTVIGDNLILNNVSILE